MATIIADDLHVCGSCAQVIANGEINDRTDEGDRIVALQVEIWGNDAWGLILDDTDDMVDFSTRRCDGCGTYLAGERFPAVVLSH